MIQIPEKYKDLILETIEEALYKIALNMEDLKGGPMTPQRKKLDKKQKELEALQHKISVQS
ncbi:MAG: hypothetical protein RLN79_01090 [Cytophagales bacterium]